MDDEELDFFSWMYDVYNPILAASFDTEDGEVLIDESVLKDFAIMHQFLKESGGHYIQSRSIVDEEGREIFFTIMASTRTNIGESIELDSVVEANGK